MLLVALSAPQVDLALLSGIGDALGLAPADVRQRMASGGPWVLAVAATAEPLEQKLPLLAGLKVRAAICDPQVIPSDDDRVLARTLEFGPTQFVATDGAGQTHACPYANLALIQRGTRTRVDSETTQTTQRRFSATRAILTGGLSLTTKEVVKQTKTHETTERFLLLTRNDGESDIILYERRLNYQFLGADMQASSFANHELVLKRLRAPTGAPLDERVSAPGFVGRLPKTRADPVDLALFLVQLANAV